jgi:hypothetical protein
MSNSDQKIAVPNLPEVTQMNLTDTFVIVRGANTFLAPKSGVYSNVQSDPVGSTAVPTVKQGTLFFSNNALYFSTANGHLKRAVMSDF